MKDRRKYVIKLKIISLIAKIGVMIGIIMFAGGVGSVDLAVETGEVLSRTREAMCYLTSLAGVPVVILCACVSNWCDETIEHVLRKRHR